jgi:hypothetical protein
MQTISPAGPACVLAACESAGKRKSVKARNGNPHLRRAVCEAAWTAAHSKRSYLSALFRRVAGRGGRKKALMAVATSLIIIAHHLIRGTHVYQELGPNYFDTLRPQRTANRLLKRPRDLGHEVILCPKTPTRVNTGRSFSNELAGRMFAIGPGSQSIVSKIKARESAVHQLTGIQSDAVDDERSPIYRPKFKSEA